jgi:uncharacterized membrane protein (UPF0127 family)
MRAVADRPDTLRCDAWLLHDGRVLASAQVARTRAERRRGLLGRDADQIDGVLVLPVRSVHTMGMRCSIDVAFCDVDGTVLRTETLAPGVPARWCRGARQVIEAPAGSFARWAVGPGDRLELRS